jgi:beclin 1
MDRFWKSHSEYLLKAATIKDDLQSLQTRYLHDSNQLDKLQKTNVYSPSLSSHLPFQDGKLIRGTSWTDDVFCIGQEGGLGTINGLRLGRLPTTLVEWPEINAAWGHTLLLLFTIARKYNFTFETYRLIPMASCSRVEKLAGDKAVYELYGSGDFQLNRLLLNRRFDQGMVAFLDCLRQLMEFVKTRDKSVVLPHMINHDRIGEVSIKLQFGSDEIWSRALRHVRTRDHSCMAKYLDDDVLIIMFNSRSC